MRENRLERKTKETNITLSLRLDDATPSTINTGIGFFDHMLTLMSFQALICMDIHCTGDLQVDGHHTVEDIGIALGKALDRALGDRAGITRYGSCMLPMDDALVTVALDISGRAYLGWDAELPASRVGDFDVELAREFCQAFSRSLGLTLHVRMHSGYNTHHILEAIFKGLGNALRQAVSIDAARADTIPSSKGVLKEIE